MAERSAQHGRRIDDEMEREVAGLTHGAPVDMRAQEDREPEPSETVTTPLGDADHDPAHRRILERSELARYLRPSAMPAAADVLLDVAREGHAPDPVIEELRRLPDGVTFSTTAEVWQALGHEVEHRARAEDDDEAIDAAEVRGRPAGTDDGARADDAVGMPGATTPGLLEVDRPQPVREALVFGLDLARGVVGLADRALARVQRTLGG